MRLRMVVIILVQGACAAVEPTGEHQASLAGDFITTTPAFRVGWAKALGDDGILWGLFAGSNRLFMSGAVSDGSSLSPGRAGVVIAALYPSGAPLWHRTFDFESVGNGVEVAGTPDDDVIVTGSRTGTTDVGCGPVSASGGTSFIARYTGATGFCQWMRVWPTHGALSVRTVGVARDVAVDEADRVNVVGEYDTPSIELGTLTLPGSDQSDIDIFAGASPRFVYLAVLDGNTGAVVRANAFGPTDPEISFLNLPRLSFGPTGLRLMGISYLYGRAQFGPTIVGEPARDEITDAVFMTLVR